MKHLVVGAEIRTRILAGAIAFITLMILEAALSISLFDRSIGESFPGCYHCPARSALQRRSCSPTLGPSTIDTATYGGEQSQYAATGRYFGSSGKSRSRNTSETLLRLVSCASR